ncbi:hypothetical protein HQQ94_12165 [Shewanella sp. VB17]|uniref:hypothetical protein n=1 Tax=Shewanella sp. VB17 TaxID=2739432 RepID=UPI001562F327|nr:hypothetical protein [Shewanella sp. VB17]NRD73978.1 hypothetical protein [Shewanella sp. VB17]
MGIYCSRISFLFLYAISTITAQAADKQNIHFAFVAEPNSNPHIRSIELIYTEAFSRLNMDFSYIVVPVIRASKMADFGSIDGEMSRVFTYGEKHPDLIRVEEPISNWQISAFTYDPSIKISSWHDIQTSQYKVEYYRGTFGVAKRLSNHISAEKLTDSSDPIHSLRKLERGRIDIFINTTALTKDLLATKEFIDNKIITAALLDNIKLYCYLHKRHSDIAVKLANIFRDMKLEGLFESYLQQANKEQSQKE